MEMSRPLLHILPFPLDAPLPLLLTQEPDEEVLEEPLSLHWQERETPGAVRHRQDNDLFHKITKLAETMLPGIPVNM